LMSANALLLSAISRYPARNFTLLNITGRKIRIQFFASHSFCGCTTLWRGTGADQYQNQLDLRERVLKIVSNSPAFLNSW
jgi:hypothetical protein